MGSLVAAFVAAFILTLARAKIYHRCELAYELRDVHEIPEHQLATWLCIVNYESHFNTSAHNPGSGDHGLFQISEIYWCSPPGTGTACGLPCSALKDDDIEDDVICARRIYREHKGFSGDGFTAWVVYDTYCRDPGHVNQFIQGCFDRENFIQYGYEMQAMNLPTVTVPVPTEEVKIQTTTPVTSTTGAPFEYTTKPTSLRTTPKRDVTPASFATRSTTERSFTSTKSFTTPKSYTFSKSFTTTKRYPASKSSTTPKSYTTRKSYTASRNFTTSKFSTPSSTTRNPSSSTRRSYKPTAARYSTYKSYFNSFSTTPRPSSSTYSSYFNQRYTSNAFKSIFGTNIRPRATQTPLPFTLKSGVKPFTFNENEQLYSFVNNGGYAYAISSHGFKLFKT